MAHPLALRTGPRSRLRSFRQAMNTELGTDGSFTYSGYTKTGFGEDAGFEPFEPVVMPCE